MPSNDYLKFRSVSHYGQPLLTEQIELNFKHWLDWAFLNIGAWQEVKVSNSGAYGQNMHILHVVDEPGYTDNTVYQSIRKDWCYETGIQYQGDAINISRVYYSGGSNYIDFNNNVYLNSGNTVSIANNLYNGDYTVLNQTDNNTVLLNASINSGVSSGGYATPYYNPMAPQIYVSGVAKSTGTSGFEHYIDYPQGRVHFTNPIADAITADYSIRSVQIYRADEFPCWVEVQNDTFDTSNIQWSQNLTSGDYAINSQHRVQLPAIIIQYKDNRNSRPFELGSLTKFERPTFTLTVLAENKQERSNICDILNAQEDKVIKLFNISKVYNSGVYPLDNRGSLNPAGSMYCNLLQNPDYIWRNLEFDKIDVSNIDIKDHNLYIGKISIIFNILM
jgi:hypothetical protein